MRVTAEFIVLPRETYRQAINALIDAKCELPISPKVAAVLVDQMNAVATWRSVTVELPDPDPVAAAAHCAAVGEAKA